MCVWGGNDCIGWVVKSLAFLIVDNKTFKKPGNADQLDGQGSTGLVRCLTQGLERRQWPAEVNLQAAPFTGSQEEKRERSLPVIKMSQQAFRPHYLPTPTHTSRQFVSSPLRPIPLLHAAIVSNCLFAAHWTSPLSLLAETTKRLRVGAADQQAGLGGGKYVTRCSFYLSSECKPGSKPVR